MFRPRVLTCKSRKASEVTVKWKLTEPSTAGYMKCLTIHRFVYWRADFQLAEVCSVGLKFYRLQLSERLKITGNICTF